MDEFRNILKDIKDRKYIESYIVFIVSLVVLVASIFTISQATLNQVVLAILSTLLYASILERRENTRLLARDTVEGIVAFQPNRNKIPSLLEHFGNAKKDISILAVQHVALVHQYLGLIQEKAEAGCHIKILMMAARDENGKVNPNVMERKSQLTYTGLLSQLESSTDSFDNWLNSLSVLARENVVIRTYKEHPISTYLFIDKDEPDGYVQVETLLYGIHVNDMPHYVVLEEKIELSSIFT